MAVPMQHALALERIRIDQAARRLAGVVRRTPLASFPAGPAGDPRIELRLKLECLQETGSFKARGAWNNVAQLGEAERAAGVVATSSGNHGRALSWAARRAGVPATIFMPADAYPNKVEACRELGAEVVLCPTREAAEEACAERVRAGAVLIHPFDAERTIEGAGTVGLEIARDWPSVEAVAVPAGGGGLISGIALALERELGAGTPLFGVEPAGAPTLGRALEAGEPVFLPSITTSVQGLCPLAFGHLNTAICRTRVRRAFALEDAAILAAQRRLVHEGGWVVEPAGAAAAALFFAPAPGGLPPEIEELLEGRGPADPLRVAVVVSGGNPDPAQLEALR